MPCLLLYDAKESNDDYTQQAGYQLAYCLVSMTKMLQAIIVTKE